MIRRSNFSVIPACYNRATCLAASPQQLTLLAVVRNRPLCQAPRLWFHNAIPWWCYIKKYKCLKSWVGPVNRHLTSRDKNKTASLRVLTRLACTNFHWEVRWTVSRNHTISLSYQDGGYNCVSIKRSSPSGEGIWSGYYTIIGFNQGVLGLAVNPARWTSFWSQNTEGVVRGVLTDKARPEGWVFNQTKHPMIKTYYSMSLHPNTAIIVFKLLAIVEWKR